MKCFALRFAFFLVLVVICPVGGGCHRDEAVGDANLSGGFDAEQIELPPEEQLRDEIDDVIAFTGGRYMTAKDHAAWQIVHGIVGFGRGLQIYDHQDELVSALDYLLAGGTLRGWNLFEASHGVGTLLNRGRSRAKVIPTNGSVTFHCAGFRPISLSSSRERTSRFKIW